MHVATTAHEMALDRNHVHLLIVEDHEDTREAIALRMRYEGFDVATAGDGADALWQLRHGLRPRVILLDLNMPDKNGRQFRTEQILDPRLESIPVVAYSGDPDFYSASVEMGAVACLRKPVAIGELIDIVRAQCATAPDNSIVSPRTPHPRQQHR
jgi:CheY-like chemotaxis protein